MIVDEKVVVFYYVALYGSMKRTAEFFKTTQPNLSQKISMLEYQLGVQLFKRGNVGSELTEKGSVLFEAVSEMIEQSERAIAMIGNKSTPDVLKILAHVSFLSAVVAPNLSHFQSYLPGVKLSLISGIAYSEKCYTDFDVVIGPHSFSNPVVLQELVDSEVFSLYASDKYIDIFGTPVNVTDLDDHRLIASGDMGDQDIFNTLSWHLSIGRADFERRHAYISVSSVIDSFVLCAFGMGITSLSTIFSNSIEHMGLVPILPGVLGPRLDIYASYRKASLNAKLAETFIQALYDLKEKDVVPLTVFSAHMYDNNILEF